MSLLLMSFCGGAESNKNQSENTEISNSCADFAITTLKNAVTKIILNMF